MTSSPNFQCIPLQEELCAKRLKDDRLMDTVTEAGNFIRANALNYLVFVALLEHMGK
jgi:hypothetical protein